jgi:hypothetical protein
VTVPLPAEREEIEFVPKYSFRHRMVLYFIGPLMALAGLLPLFLRPKDLMGYSPLLFPLCMPLLLFFTYRRVRFGTSIVAERYLLPPRSIEYSSITDVGVGLITSTQGKLYFMPQNCDNIEEFDAAVEESRRRGYWSDQQIEHKVLGQQLASTKAQLIGVPVAIVGAIVLTFAHPGGLRWPWLAWFFVIYLPLSLGLYAYYKRRSAGEGGPGA